MRKYKERCYHASRGTDAVAKSTATGLEGTELASQSRLQPWLFFKTSQWVGVRPLLSNNSQNELPHCCRQTCQLVEVCAQDIVLEV